MPQLTSQSSHKPQSVRTQSTGQLFCPQLVSSMSDPISSHGVPSALGCTAMLRKRFRVPLPQDREQPPHWSQSAYSQSIGQSPKLQSDVCVVFPTQWAPPNSAAFRKSRERLLVPGPQVELHAEYFDQSAHKQSTGQSFFVHSLDSLALPSQALPCPCAIILTFRVLMDSPPPHVNWQTLQSTQSFQTQSTSSAVSSRDSISPATSTAAPRCRFASRSARTARISRGGSSSSSSGRLVAGVTQRAQRANPRSCPARFRRRRLCAKSILYICSTHIQRRYAGN